MGVSPTTTKEPSTSSTTGDGERQVPRKLNRSANQLHRNQACLTCRRRRIKCDAGRPHCSSCVRSYRFLARTQPDPERDARGIQCVYERSEVPEDGQGDEDPRAVVAKLEARVAELQEALDRLTSTSPTSSVPCFGQQTTPPLGQPPSPPELQSPVQGIRTTPPQIAVPFYPQGMMWPTSLELDPTFDPVTQTFCTPASYNPSFPFGPCTLPSSTDDRTSPVSASSGRLSWDSDLTGGPIQLSDGNTLDDIESRVIGDAMTRYVEMSMSGMGHIGSSHH